MTQMIGRWRFALGLILVLAVGALGLSAQAQQENTWVQVEAHGSAAEASDRARAYATLIGNVNVFSLGTGTYGVALGPYSEADADAVLAQLQAQGIIPRDAFVVDGVIYREQVWPEGVNRLQPPAVQNAETADRVAETPAPAPAPAPAPEAAPAPAVEPAPAPEAAPAPAVEPAPAPETAEAPEPEPAEVAPLVAEIIPEETLAEARRSEAGLNRAEREDLQIALEWFGFYNAGIDAAFGPGTRAGMRAWQEAEGLEVTGVLTTRQRAQLLGDYAEALAALGMRTVRDPRAGVEIDMPMAMVEFGRYEFPFAQYDSTGNSGVRVLLISQAGDRATLAGLYEIMQTLEIVPLQGDRSRRRDSFVLTGQNDETRSHTVARHQNGQVKGFTLIWTPEHDTDMARVVQMMEDSLTFFGGVLDPGAIDQGLNQDIDLISGLEVRRPALTRSGFYADAGGTVMTTAEAVAQCGRIMIDSQYEARVSHVDEALGLAVLRPVDRLAPPAHAAFAGQPGRLRTDVALAGFPYDGALGAASLNFGTLVDMRGLNGEAELQRLDMETTASETGGPILDARGAVLGMAVPVDTGGRTLPAGVSFALRGDVLNQGLRDAGIAPSTMSGGETLNRETLARMAARMTVLVTCWN